MLERLRRSARGWKEVVQSGLIQAHSRVPECNRTN